METYRESKKMRLAKRLGVFYFLLLGIVNFCCTLIFANVHAIDVYILALCCLPLLIRNKYFSATYGIVVGVLAFVMGYACLTFNLDLGIPTSQISYVMGYLLSASMLFASFLLVYGNSSSGKQPLLME